MEYFSGTYKKYTSNNPLIKFALSMFFNDLDELIDLIGIGSLSNILDAGCGEGFVINHIYERYKNENMYIEGIDIMKEALEIAKSLNPNIRFSIGDIYKLDYPDNCFDLVLATEILEHLGNPEKAIEEIKRVTRKYVIASVPREPIWRIANIIRGSYLSRFGNTPGHIQKWTEKEFLALLNGHFKVVKVKKPVFLWTMALCEK
jgi:ubiquinone/menaquinone biosynthesis C-methylase UbiE